MAAGNAQTTVGRSPVADAPGSSRPALLALPLHVSFDDQEADGGMRPGGGVRIAIPRTWTQPQTTQPAALGYVMATASNGATLDVTLGDYPNIEWYVTAVTTPVGIPSSSRTTTG